MEEARMALKRLVSSAAVLAIFACSDGSPESAAVPPFSGNLPSAPSTMPVAPAGTRGQVPMGANPDPSSSEAGAEADSAAGQRPGEGQNPDIVGIAGSEAPPASSS